MPGFTGFVKHFAASVSLLGCARRSPPNRGWLTHPSFGSLLLVNSTSPGGKPTADAVPPSEGKFSPFARCARQAYSFSFLGEDIMLEALGIVLVALAFLAFLVVISRSF